MVSSSPPLRVLLDYDGKHRKWSAVVPHLVFCFPKVEAFGTATNIISFDRCNGTNGGAEYPKFFN